MDPALLEDLAADGFGHWLAGFIDGEGCFSIGAVATRRVEPYYGCRFTLALREDDRPALEAAQGRTGIGRVVARASYAGSRPGALWIVRKHADCLALAEILDRFPLRAKKAADLAIWRDAVQEWTGGVVGPGYRVGAKQNRQQMAEFKRRLEDGRKFVSG